MATQSDRFLRYLWINGVPYMTRDESAQTEILKVKAVCENLNDRVETHRKKLDKITEVGDYTGPIDWKWNAENTEKYIKQVTNSKIPYFTVKQEYNTTDTQVDATNLYNLDIALR